jgi:hypothetical protein
MSPCHAYRALLLPAGPTHPDSCSLAPDKPDIRSLDSSDAYPKTASPGGSIIDFVKQQRIAQQQVNSSASTGTKGIALGQEQEDRARRAGFTLEDCGNAWRIVKEDNL